MNRTEIYDALEEKNGRSFQVMVCVEELAELSKELSKLVRYKGYSTDKLIEELADVEICLSHIKRMYEVDTKQIDVWKTFKFKRLRLREGL